MARKTKLSPEHRRKIGQAQIGNKRALGNSFKLTQEQKDKIQMSKLGKPRPDLLGNKLAVGHKASRTKAKHGSRAFYIKIFGIIKECERCKSKKNLEIHHIDRNRRNNVKENLMPLCKSCHRKLHWSIRKSKHAAS
jgi:5-methylcytosine-specific restriction endonuclease McrA